jgi:ATP/maltotriose-dependent transcriptional regulator MalT
MPQTMRIHWKKSVAITLFLLSLVLSQSPASADVSTEETCKRLYADYLERARQALLDQKPNDAVEFLLKASVVAESCASPENAPKGQDKQPTLALALLGPAFTGSAL